MNSKRFNPERFGVSPSASLGRTGAELSKRDKLIEAYESLLKIEGECACEITEECTISDFTVRQIEYLKIIDKHGNITFSKLACLTKNSKPTITEMINRFIEHKCVYKEQCSVDGRVSHIHLTELGKSIARREQIIIYRLVDRMMNSLTDEEVDSLINLFNKVR